MKIVANGAKARVWLAGGAIWVRDPVVFGRPSDGPCLRFCERVFAVDEVRWVEVRPREATIAIECGALDRQRAAALLKRMVGALESGHALPRSPVLERVWRESQGRETIRVSRQQLGLPASGGAARPVTGLRRVVYGGLAGLSFVTAIIGVWLPGLPTVPFLLLTSWLLVRSSPSLNRRLMRSRIFGPLIHDLREHRGLRLQVKLVLVAVMIAVLTSTVLFGNLPLPLLVTILFLALIGLLQIVMLPTVRPESWRLDPAPRTA